MGTENKHILMIAYLFPPIGGSGALRPLKLAKYLPRFGWTPVVHTSKNPDWYYARDTDLLNELSADTVLTQSTMIKASWIYRLLNPGRIKSIDRFIKRYLMHPDEQIGWLPTACLAGLKLVKQYNIKVLYSTSGPLTNHLIARFIKSRTGLPWVAEFRDEWLEDPVRDFPSDCYRRFHYRLEQSIVRKADQIVVMAPAFGDFLSKHVTSTDHFVTLPAGYDPDDFPPASPPKASAVFTIVFTGLFYDTFRPNCFLKAVNELIAEGIIAPDKINIRFVGANTAHDIDEPDGYGICEFTGFVSQSQATDFLAEADLALLLLSRERGSGVIPSKVFGYLAVGKPILALVPPEGAVAKIVRQTRSGYVADFDNTRQIKTLVERLFLEWQSSGTLTINPDQKAIDQYNVQTLVAKLAGHLETMVSA